MAEGREQLEMKEYTYYVGHVPVTALLTEKMAERLNAKPSDEAGEDDAPEVGNVANNEAQRTSTQSREAEDAGVNATLADGSDSEQAAAKTRTARNKRAS